MSKQHNTSDIYSAKLGAQQLHQQFKLQNNTMTSSGCKKHSQEHASSQPLMMMLVPAMTVATPDESEAILSACGQDIYDLNWKLVQTTDG